MPKFECLTSILSKVETLSPKQIYAITLLIILAFCFLTPIQITSAQLSTSVELTITGTITDSNSNIPPELSLKYSTDFEAVTKTTSNTLDMGINNYFQTSGSFNVWMEGLDRNSGITPYSGTRCVGMETVGGYRNEFNILHMERNVFSQYYVSVWLRFPSDWDVPSTGWYALAVPLQATSPDPQGLYLPIAEIHTHKNGGIYDTSQEYGTGSSKITLNSLPNYRPPVGEWFKLEYYVYMHPTDGILRVWINDKLLADVNNLQTVNTTGQAILSTIAKIYFDPSITETYQLWVDNLQIYGD